MSEGVLYEIVRTWAVEVDDEEDENYGDTIERTERVRLTEGDGPLTYTVDDGPDIPCETTDAEAAIAGVAQLNEVRPNQVTRITAAPNLVRLLPLSLIPTGAWGDYDQWVWSDEMSDHIDESSSSALPHDVYLVLYVNESRWHRWHTDIGDRMLPGSEGGITLEKEWAYAGIYEVAEMNSGHGRSTLGLVTKSVVIEIDAPDTDFVYPPEGSTSLRIQQWSGEIGSAADILANWVMSSPVSYFFWEGQGLDADPKNFVQLFAEAAIAGDHAAAHDAYELVQASGYELDYYQRGTNISTRFGFGLGVDNNVIAAAAEIIGRADPAYSSMIVAARDPSSPEAAARDERLRAIRYEHFGDDGAEDEDSEDDDDES